MQDGDYVSKFWQVVFQSNPLQVAAVVKRPRGSTEWRVVGRILVCREHLCGDDSQDVKWWFQSPAYGTEEEAVAAWWSHLRGFMDESNLTVLEQHEIVLETASVQAVTNRLLQEKFVHRSEPDSEDEKQAPEATPKAALLN